MVVKITRVAVIDIGTNSTRLLLAGLSGSGKIKPLYTELKATRLGEGIEGGMLLAKAISRTVAAIVELAAEAEKREASVFVAVATSAVRGAKNREVFLDEVYQKTGIQVRVLNGLEEAFFNYMGVSGECGDSLQSSVIVDIGGGSTEFTWEQDGKVFCRSIKAGAVRMTEGGHSDQCIREIMKETLGDIRRVNPHKLIGVGGTVTTLAAVDIGLERYDRSLVHGYILTRIGICQHMERFIAATPEGRKRIPGLQPERSDIIVAGVRILLNVMDYLEMKEIQVSEADLMYGLAWGSIAPVEIKYAIDSQ